MANDQTSDQDKAQDRGQIQSRSNEGDQAESQHRTEAERRSERPNDQLPRNAVEHFREEADKAARLANDPQSMAAEQINKAPAGKQGDVPTGDPSYQLPDELNPVPQGERWMETETGHRYMVPEGMEPPLIPDPAVQRDSGRPELADPYRVYAHHQMATEGRSETFGGDEEDAPRRGRRGRD